MDDRNPNPAVELNRLLGEAQAMADAARCAYRPLPEVAQATDHTGAVTVTMEDHSARVARVSVAADWKNKLSVASLGVAVMEATMALQLGPVKDFFETLSDAAASPGPPPPPPPLPASLPDFSKLSWDDLGDMLDTVNRAFDALAATTGTGKGAGNDQSTGKTVGRSANHRVEVTLASGQLTSVAIDEKWASTAGRQQLSDSLNQAFEAAYATVPCSGQGCDEGAATELRALLQKVGIELPPPQGRILLP
ncbi:MAG: hypothetical protein JO345_20450 [Streptosporangiaceae bacterium]|nr:hypothetical protein [Streptosporangiaceae bacterium]